MQVLLWCFFLLHAAGIKYLGKRIEAFASAETRGFLHWMIWICVFLPIIGELLSLIIWCYMRVSSLPSTNIERKEKRTSQIKQVRFDRENDRKILPATVVINGQDSELQKSYILKLFQSKMKGSYMLLKQTLRSDDPEIVHYGATMINALSDSFKREIGNIEATGEKRTLEEYQRISQLYLDYLESGLLNKSDEESVFERYKKHVEQAVSEYTNDITLLNHYAVLLYKEGMLEKAYTYYSRITEASPFHYSGYIGMIKISYEQQAWKRLRKRLTDLDKYVNVDEIPWDDYRKIQLLEGMAL
ncbi:tetratricopeptide (TPR) repeat protein [Salibacterium salarium]|uniref:tetratricopeptide repeat protein n=1 Tax=Salibacterium salarium TaxID=284579 RepID=UPI0027805D26|nr:hypothetical protein [Salibacterium salarium]MDQ0300121.1 tetratricopeptide (TPR) repeat protein [Salibacterium salarium]